MRGTGGFVMVPVQFQAIVGTVHEFTAKRADFAVDRFVMARLVMAIHIAVLFLCLVSWRLVKY